MNLTKKVLTLILCMTLLIPSVALASSENNFSKVVPFQGENYRIEVTPLTETTMLNRVTNLRTNEVLESYVDVHSNIVLIEGDEYGINEEIEHMVTSYAVCKPGQTKTRRSTISLFNVKIQDAANKGKTNDMVFLSLLTAALAKAHPIAGAVGFITGAITAGSIDRLYNSYKDGEMNVEVVATYHYKCVEMYDYDPGFDYQGGTHVPMWTLVDISW